MEETKPAEKSTFWLFVAKTAAFLLLLAIFLDFMMPDFGDIKRGLYSDIGRVKEKLDKNFKRDQTKFYILGMIQNPAALYKTSEAEEREGKVDNAIRDMELAIGLLEMHNADKQVVKRYYSRLEKLQAEAKGRK